MRDDDSSHSMLAAFQESLSRGPTSEDYSVYSNERLLFILNQFSGVAPYSHEFVQGLQDAQVISGIVSAMTSFMGDIMGEERTHWRTQYGTDSTLIVEGGDWAVGVLVVKRETNELRSMLRRVVKEFEDCFFVLRDADGIEGGAFKDFDHFVRRTFVGDRLSKRSVILKGLGWNATSIHLELPSRSFKTLKLLSCLKDRDTLDDAQSITGTGFDDTSELVSRALWKGSINIVYVPDEGDILLVSEGASSLLLNSGNPLGLSIDTIRIVGALDGRTSLASLFRRKKSENIESSFLELGLLVNEGLIQRASLERQLVLVNECILTQMMKAYSRIAGGRIAKRKLRTAIDRILTHHPWAARIEYTRGMRITCQIENSLTFQDLNHVCDSIEELQQEVKLQVSLDNPELAESILKAAKRDCHYKWAPYLRELIA